MLTLFVYCIFFRSKQIAPVYAKLAGSNPHVKFLRVDVDAQKAIAAKYQVSAMPTFLAIKAGKVVDTVRIRSFQHPSSCPVRS
jgi:thioredoxin-like negative regulator of GroEL